MQMKSTGIHIIDFPEINSHLTAHFQTRMMMDLVTEMMNTYSTNPLSGTLMKMGLQMDFVAQGFDPLINYSAFRTETVDITEALNQDYLVDKT